MLTLRVRSALWIFVFYFEQEGSCNIHCERKMNWSLIVAGLLVHVVFFYSIFEIYFTSPLVHGMTPHQQSAPAPANRVVLFVGDGLRADSFYELDSSGESKTPFLRSIIEAEGVWGVSHTRVPTESRPGHVALIAGFYEDVSAVAKGWKENPVEFDSVFNESRYTWSWGSPDILPMFAKGASGDHVFTRMYPAESEDFAGADASKLDTWVFDSVKEFLEEARKDSALLEKLNKDRIVFFLHLLGIDVNGHSHKPGSREYARNIAIVDEGISAMVEAFEDLFQHDNKTSYIFTSDHGMTDWGSHGASSADETLTPIVSWGAGVRKALPAGNHEQSDALQKAWRLDHVTRCDVEQADVASLMSALIGSPFPLQSVGRVPLDFLSAPEPLRADAVYANARQMLEQFRVKMEQKKSTTLSALFTPYKPLLPDQEELLRSQTEQFIGSGRYREAVMSSQHLIDLALDGLGYYHHYDRFFLGTSLTFGFIGWTAYVVVIILDKHTLITLTGSRQTLHRSPAQFWSSDKGIRLLFIMLGLVISLLVYAQSLPLTHYLYTLIPVLLWHQVVQQRSALYEAWYYVRDHGYVLHAFASLLLGVLAIETIVLSFFHRQILSAGLVVMATWPWFTPNYTNSKLMSCGWVFSCLFLAVFPALPPVGREANYPLVYAAGAVCVIAACVAARRPEAKCSAATSNVFVLIVGQICILAVSVFVVWSTSQSIINKEGLPLLNQLFSWAALVCSFVLPLLSDTSLYCRLLSIALAVAPVYILLSMSHEGLFVVGLCALLFCWLHLENDAVYKKPQRLEELDFSHGPGILESRRKLWLSDVRMAYFFCYLLITAFFGTGNIASINSFDPSSVYCFLTVFSPFTMAALMLWKILIPFVLVSCTFTAIHLALNVPTQSLFLLVLLMSDCMALHFFFLVQDYGSWLEIGTSISHYVIVMSFISFIILLLALSQVLTSSTLSLRGRRKKHAL